MSSPLNLISRERFTSDGVSALINLPGNVEQILVRDISNLNAPANTEFVEASWSLGMNNGSALVRSYTAAAPATEVAVVAADGIGQVDTSLQNSLGAPNTGVTAISQAGPAVVSLPSTAGLANGDVVRVSASTGMLQIAGWDFTIGGLVANTSFELSFLDSTLFAAAATAGTIRRVNNPPLYSPRQFLITNISQAAEARVTVSVTSDVAVGEEIAFVLPDDYGMGEINGLRGTVVRVGQADASGFTNTFDVDIDSSAFTAFAFPASASFQSNFPQAVRFGNTSELVLGSTDNVGAFQVQLGSAVVGDAGDLIEVLLLSGTSL